jgi:hypothetical protein
MCSRDAAIHAPCAIDISQSLADRQAIFEPSTSKDWRSLITEALELSTKEIEMNE